MRDREELERLIDYYVTGNPEHYDEVQDEELEDNRDCDFSIPEVENENDI